MELNRRTLKTKETERGTLSEFYLQGLGGTGLVLEVWGLGKASLALAIEASCLPVSSHPTLLVPLAPHHCVSLSSGGARRS